MKLPGKIFAAALLALCCAMPLSMAQSRQNDWVETKAISGNFKAVIAQSDIEIFSAPNNIIVKVNRGVDLRLFTILGKLVSYQHLEPGIFQCHIDAHGIYIIKTPDTSCKIAI